MKKEVERYDVVMDYDWTSVPRRSILRNKAPIVIIKAYKVKKNEALNRLNSYLNILEADPMQFYKKLYSDATQEEYVFNLPYFGDSVRSFSNEYGDTFQAGFMGSIDNMLKSSADELGAMGSTLGVRNPAIGSWEAAKGFASDLNNKGGVESFSNLKSKIGEASKTFVSSPGSYIETPKIYQYMNNDAPLSIDIVLSNTINMDYQEKNVKLIDRLIRINRPERINSVEMRPPYIYNVQVPGLRYMEWAYCSSFDVRLLGTRRMINDKIIPEGYMINISLTSLTTEVSNFMDKI